MESDNYGEMDWGSGSCSAGSSSKKGKREKQQKQPQRGLGVAQLEKIRIQSELAEYLPSIHHSPFHTSNPSMTDARSVAAVSLSPSSSFSLAAPSSIFTPRPNVTMAFGGSERRERSYSESQSTTYTPPMVSSLPSPPSYIFPHNTYQGNAVTTLPLFEEGRKDSRHCDQIDLGSDSSDAEELDLELRL